MASIFPRIDSSRGCDTGVIGRGSLLGLVTTTGVDSVEARDVELSLRSCMAVVREVFRLPVMHAGKGFTLRKGNLKGGGIMRES